MADFRESSEKDLGTEVEPSGLATEAFESMQGFDFSSLGKGQSADLPGARVDDSGITFSAAYDGYEHDPFEDPAEKLDDPLHNPFDPRYGGR